MREPVLQRPMITVAAVLCLGLFLLKPAPSPADTLNVPLSYSTIQSAIDAAVDGDTVLVADGKYVERINFDGKTIIVRSVNGAAAAIIDGAAGGTVVTFNSGEGVGSVLAGFTIQNGSTANHGGGIYCDQSSPTITNCIISSNKTTGDADTSQGGGIACFNGSSAIIRYCTVSNNSAANVGGICCDNSSVIIEHCTISNNQSEWDSGGVSFGGVMAPSRPRLSHCTISHNSTSLKGGGIGGGGLAVPTIEHCVIYDNYATNDSGGGVYLSNGSSSTTIANTLIISNSVSDNGGGICCWNGNSTNLFNCTVSGNSAGNSGGGVAIGNGSSLTIANSILWEDTAGTSDNEIYFSEGGFVRAIYSDIQGGYPGIGNIDSDPLFIGGGNYYLAAGSPCIDTGTGMNVPPDDIDGNARPQGAGYDMGAYESIGHACLPPPAPVVISYPSTCRSGRFTISWPNVKGATGYTLQRATNSTFSDAVTVYNGNSNSYKETCSKKSLLSSGKYCYRVRAKNSCKNGDWKAGNPITVIWP